MDAVVNKTNTELETHTQRGTLTKKGKINDK
jgi:hypothetical protein